MKSELKGWKYIVYIIIRNNFDEFFTLQELYNFVPYFENVYPKNTHVRAKIRQTLQYLRDDGYIEFVGDGVYNLTNSPVVITNERSTPDEHIVYILVNKSIPEWIKIGRTSSIDRRLKELYNTSVPLPFEHFYSIQSGSLAQAEVLEKSIHSIIDTINPDLRKNTAARKREFFRLTKEEGRSIFDLVMKIMNVNTNVSNDLMRHSKGLN